MPNEPIEWVDPEEIDEDWEPPTLEAGALVDNTAVWKFFYRWRGRSPKRSWPLAVGVTREITAPWRRGVGISFSYSGDRVTYGVWWRGGGPDPVARPREVRLRKVLRRAKKYDRTIIRSRQER